jgi:rhodanese-related sulfurtransferase/rubrerythrin
MRWKQFFTPVANMASEELRDFIARHAEGSYTLLDVRQPSEHQSARIPGATLVPLPELTGRLEELHPERPVVVYCAVGGRSRAAAQLLAGQGFTTVYNLQGGIKAWEGRTAVGPPEAGLMPLRGDETAAEWIVLSYGLEEGLRGFYAAMAASAKVPRVALLLGDLAAVEDLHKDRLFQLYTRMVPQPLERKTFEERIDAGQMEGGFTTEDFIRLQGPAVQSVLGVLDLAMGLETQALDLYLRHARRVAAEPDRQVFLELAEEEKNHLRRLGTLLDQQAAEGRIRI